MEVAADAGRQLYGYGYTTVWDHSPNTYASAYLAMITGIVAAFLTWTQWSGLKGEKWGLCMQTILACLFQGVGFGMAGIAFHVVDTKSERGQYVDTDIWGNNSGWIFPWFFAVVVKPLSSACLLGAATAYVGTTAARFRAVQVVNAIGACVAIYEAFLVLTDQIFATPGAEFYWGMFATGVSCGIVPVLGWKQVGMWWIFIGFIIRFVGYLYTVFGPCSLVINSYGDKAIVCPFPQDPMKDCLFNICIAISVVPIYYGAVRKSTLDHEYQELLKKEQAEKQARAWAKENSDRTCCIGGCGS